MAEIPTNEHAPGPSYPDFPKVINMTKLVQVVHEACAAYRGCRDLRCLRAREELKDNVLVRVQVVLGIRFRAEGILHQDDRFLVSFGKDG
jgi:hypothetical protein